MIKRIIILSFILVLLGVNISAADIGYLISIQRTNEDLSLKSIELIGGPISNYQQAQGYNAKMLSFKSEEIFNYNFTVGQIPFFSGPISRNQYNESEELITLILPYYNNAKKIEILDENGKLKLEIDLSSYARCNENDFCDFNEDLQRCPEDCRKEIERPVKVEEKESPEVEIIEKESAALETEEPKEKTLIQKLEEQGISPNLLIIIAVLAIILILILILSRKKEK